MDNRIIKKIGELVNVGVKDTHEMRRHLNVYVANEILSKDEVHPSPLNCRFFPKLSGIQSHMYTASTRNCFSKIDQQNISGKINQWSSSNPEDFFFFRPYGEVSSGSSKEEGNPEEMATNTLLFVRQTMWQRRLL